MSIFLIFSIVCPFLFLVIDMWGNSFDAHFSEKTLRKLNISNNSFLRKVIPFKEKDYMTKEGIVYGHRYFLSIRAVPLLIYTILILVLLPVGLVNLFIPFLPDLVMICLSVIFLAYIILHEVIIAICSQGLHL